MNILFIHQNFPGQFKHLSVALAKAGHHVVALTLRVKEPTDWNGVKILPYSIRRKTEQKTHPWMLDLDTKVTRAESCFHAASKLKEAGYNPDVIIAHHGWGESLFLRDVWPKARIGLYCELYHLAGYPHVGFDREFSRPHDKTEAIRLRLKNLNNELHFQIAQAGISPTKFQANTFPASFRDRITVVHDGIDTEAIKRNQWASYQLPTGPTLTRKDEVITFVNRNLEPYRGYHVFMRALPDLLKSRPNAQIMIVGGDGVSYGAAAPAGKTWKQIFIDEVRGQIPDADWARVHFLGRIPYSRFVELLQLSRVHIYLTYPFVLSWSLFEAMSAEAAIVASGTEPVREAIVHDETGRLVDFFDGGTLVDEVGRLLDSAEARTRLGRTARNLIRERYDLKTISLPRQMQWVQDLADMTV
ncbi:glycosyl transferase [Oceanicola sp. 22II-s10i]|uniref:glycosyltransferase n=1 Tax=Oceanicola sp. 22II-s10i TaxID=1317116 RepID=UPI000B528A2E|nr:glycosyltransferase [Oceanicola sp. 22II-s10i]OWU86137.1 glycosyl transferase [Oceanicola sp. 22II-s10i]